MTANRKLKLHSFAEWSKRPPAGMLIPDFIPEGQLGFVVAKSGSLKTFLLAKIAFLAGAGGEWMGQPIRRFATIYFATENAGSLSNRQAMEMRRNGFDGHDAFLIADPIDLLNPNCAGEILDVIKRAEEQTDLPVKLIIIDTMRDAWSGNEDSSTETARALSTVKRVRDVGKKTVLLSHHTGHEGTRARGSYNLYANVDFQFVIDKCDGVATARCTKMRDGDTDIAFSFKLESDDNGDVGLEFVDTPARDQIKRPLSGQKGIALTSLHDATAAEGRLLPASMGLPAGLYGVDCSTWRRYFYDRLGDIAGDSKRRAFDRNLTSLQQHKLIGVEGEWAWLVVEAGSDRTGHP